MDDQQAAGRAALNPAPRRGLSSARGRRPRLACALSLGVALAAASVPLALAAQGFPGLSLDQLPRPRTPPAEPGPVVPAQVERWREEAKRLEHGEPPFAERNPVKAAELYCRAARYGDAEAQFNLAWMLTHARGIERDEAQAAHLMAAAAEQGMAQAEAMLARMGGTPLGAPPPCLRPPDNDPVTTTASAVAHAPAMPVPPSAARAGTSHATKPTAHAARAWPPPPPHAPPALVKFVELTAGEFQLAPALVLAVIATESNFDASAISPKNAQGLMQMIPDTARRFGVRNPMDPVQNVRGGMAYLRWLLAYFEGDIALAAAAYNAGEAAVNRYRGVPPYAETRLYVRKILAHLGGRRDHPFDAKVTEPSPVLALIRGPARWR